VFERTSGFEDMNPI